MSGYDVGQWSDFGVALAATAAALTGLLFVAVSINLGRVLQFPQLPVLAGAALVQLSSALFAALFLLVPQSPSALGFELAVEGVVLALVPVPTQVRVRRSEYWSELTWSLTRLGPSLGVSLLLVLAGIGVAQQVLGGLYLLAAAVILAVVAGLGYAWILLVEIQR